MITNPIISVIVPCFNQGKYLHETLQSLHQQSFKNWECLVIDDGSTDNTSDVAGFWVNSDPRFKYYRNKNSGLSFSRNFGIRNSSGKFIQFCDSDDVLLREKLHSSIFSLQHSNNYSVYLCDYHRGTNDNIYDIDINASYLPPIINNDLTLYELIADWEFRISIPAHCFMFTRDFFDSGIEFNNLLQNHEDWECWVKIFHRAKNIFYDPRKLVIYRNNIFSMSKNNDDMKIGFLKAIEFLLNNKEFGRDIIALLKLKFFEVNYSYEYKKLVNSLLAHPSL